MKSLLDESHSSTVSIPELLTYMQYNINRCDASKGQTYQLAKQFGQQLIEHTREVIGQPPVYKNGEFSYHIFI